MLKDKKSAQNYTLLSEELVIRLWEKTTNYWICKNNRVTALSLSKANCYAVTDIKHLR